MKYCQNCQSENKDVAKFCSSCGKEFEISENKDNVEIDSFVKEEKINTRTSLDKVSFILGIISVGALLMCTFFPVAIITGPLAIITGIISLTKVPRNERKKAIIAIVLGSVGLIYAILLFIFIPILLDFVMNFLNDYCLTEGNEELCEMLKSMLPNLFK